MFHVIITNQNSVSDQTDNVTEPTSELGQRRSASRAQAASTTAKLVSTTKRSRSKPGEATNANNLNVRQPVADLGNYSSNSSFFKSCVDLSQIVFAYCYSSRF